MKVQSWNTDSNDTDCWHDVVVEFTQKEAVSGITFYNDTRFKDELSLLLSHDREIVSIDTSKCDIEVISLQRKVNFTTLIFTGVKELCYSDRQTQQGDAYYWRTTLRLRKEKQHEDIA